MLLKNRSGSFGFYFALILGKKTTDTFIKYLILNKDGLKTKKIVFFTFSFNL